MWEDERIEGYRRLHRDVMFLRCEALGLDRSAKSSFVVSNYRGPKPGEKRSIALDIALSAWNYYTEDVVGKVSGDTRALRLQLLDALTHEYCSLYSDFYAEVRDDSRVELLREFKVEVNEHNLYIMAGAIGLVVDVRAESPGEVRCRFIPGVGGFLALEVWVPVWDLEIRHGVTGATGPCGQSDLEVTGIEGPVRRDWRSDPITDKQATAIRNLSRTLGMTVTVPDTKGEASDIISAYSKAVSEKVAAGRSGVGGGLGRDVLEEHHARDDYDGYDDDFFGEPPF